MSESARLKLNIELTGLDRREASQVLTTAFPGTSVTFAVTMHPAGGRHYAARLEGLTTDDARELLGQLMAQWRDEDDHSATTGRPAVGAREDST